MLKIKQKARKFWNKFSTNIYWLFATSLVIITIDVLTNNSYKNLGNIIYITIIVSVWSYMVNIIWQTIWIKIIKPRMVKKLAKEVAATFKTSVKTNYKIRNLSIDDIDNGFAKPLNQTWQMLFNNWPNNDLNDAVPDDKALTSILHDQYVVPIHEWCLGNLSNDFFLWYDKNGVHLLFVDGSDRILWKLRWDNQLPTPKEVFDLKYSS